MKYRNARNIFPENLLKQIQRYVSGETIYIPAGDEKKAWGETSGYKQYIHERNGNIRDGFSNGKSMYELMEEYSLSYDSIKRIVYNKKEVTMLKYNSTLSSAKAYAEAGKLDSWIHLYLNENGRNVPFSDGLKLVARYYLSPIIMPLKFFTRCTGPEPEMKYQIDKNWFEYHVSELEKAIQDNPDMPPLIVHYVEGEFELNDGNHRYKAYENLGIDKVWVIVWITEQAEYDDFMSKYSEYTKDVVAVRR